MKPKILRILVIGCMFQMSLAATGDVGKPQAFLPVGPSEQWPVFTWTTVPDATKYQIKVHTQKHKCASATNYPTFAEQTQVLVVDAKARCSLDKCSVSTKPQDGRPSGIVQGQWPLGYIHCTKDMNGTLVSFHWTVQAFIQNTPGPESDMASYSLR